MVTFLRNFGPLLIFFGQETLMAQQSIPSFSLPKGCWRYMDTIMSRGSLASYLNGSRACGGFLDQPPVGRCISTSGRANAPRNLVGSLSKNMSLVTRWFPGIRLKITQARSKPGTVPGARGSDISKHPQQNHIFSRKWPPGHPAFTRESVLPVPS